MKVILINDENTKLTKADKRKVSILKLTENGRYLDGIGIKDNNFFLLVEDETDAEYLEFMQHRPLKGGVKTTKDKISSLQKLLAIGAEVDKIKERLSGRKESN